MRSKMLSINTLRLVRWFTYRDEWSHHQTYSSWHLAPSIHLYKEDQTSSSKKLVNNSLGGRKWNFKHMLKKLPQDVSLGLKVCSRVIVQKFVIFINSLITTSFWRILQFSILIVNVFFFLHSWLFLLSAIISGFNHKLSHSIMYVFVIFVFFGGQSWPWVHLL